MVRPSWVTAVGVLGIIFGCTGILGGGQQMLMPKMLEFQKQMMSDMSAKMQRADKNSNCHSASAAVSTDSGSGGGSNGASIGASNAASDTSGAPAAPVKPCQAAPFPDDAFNVFKDFWNFPPWFGIWMEVSGALRCLVAGFYLFSAIWFIQMKPSSIWLFSAALSLSILLGIAQLVATFFAGTFLLAAMMAGSSVGMVIDAVLLVVIWMSDRSAFRPRPAALESSPVTP